MEGNGKDWWRESGKWVAKKVVRSRGKVSWKWVGGKDGTGWR